MLELLVALMYARKAAFSNPVGMRQFVMRSGRSPKYYIRANAIDLVEVLAKGGDRDALELLKSLANDEHMTVRNNAVISLRKFGE